MGETSDGFLALDGTGARQSQNSMVPVVHGDEPVAAPSALGHRQTPVCLRSTPKEPVRVQTGRKDGIKRKID